RRSRARRKEYTLELEAKVRAYEQEGVSASAEIQAAARRVVVENEVLREEVIRLRAENEMLRRGVGLEERISEGRDDQRSNQAVGGTREGGDVMPTSSAGKRKRANDYDNDGKAEESKRRMFRPPPTSCQGSYTTSPQHNPPISTTTCIPPLKFPQQVSASPTSSSPTFTFPSIHPTATGTAYPSPPTSSQCKFSHGHYPPLPPPRHPQSSYSPYASESHPVSSPRHLPPPAPQRTTEDADTDPDTSSCHLAAQIITSMRSDISCEQVRQELGCREREECNVENARLLDVMGRFA
ncbi:MAG: hypothetical protein Q9198_008617, partial [Flavoplaca austrocitrina]